MHKHPYRRTCVLGGGGGKRVISSVGVEIYHTQCLMTTIWFSVTFGFISRSRAVSFLWEPFTTICFRKSERERERDRDADQTVRGAEVVCQYAVHHHQKSPDLDIVRRISCGGENRSTTESKHNEFSLRSVTDT